MGSEDTCFESFVSREQAGLLRLAVLLAGDRGHAEDLVQTALLRTYRHWDRVAGRGDPTAYVRRAVVTAHTSWRRRLSTGEQVVESVPDRAGPADERDGDEELRAALRTLPPRMRAAVVLRYYADLSEQQAAQAMGCSASAVNTQTTRGLARLRALLTAPVPVPGEGSRWTT
ncbi:MULTISPECIES: SigE family RNA polymerase sigma factor [Geodermatophilus]|uniref:RNA polymerase sigma-70 factor, sigma-E family n=1 Tax=Geodermatophilus nigrescens TaxID=1070870 RepID=A0A1M5S9Q2_9ACTN|nr:SigE family RNA polymerase sigma factor [Geodermatophilus nigrescens]SHH35195.1 RNA polymerase sigma-70 factor, sigma-E family [Geodermatophilus nigrescens]